MDVQFLLEILFFKKTALLKKCVRVQVHEARGEIKQAFDDYKRVCPHP